MNHTGRRSLTIAMFSRNFFGAERRFLRIIELLEADFAGVVRVNLLVNSSLVVAMSRNEWGSSWVDRLRAGGQLIVVPDRISHLHMATRVLSAVRSVFSSTPMHVVLRARPIGYFRAALSRPTSFEITSPDVADQVGKDEPLWLVRRVSSFRTVSPAVHARFTERIKARARASDYEAVVERTICSSSPFVVAADAELVDFDSKSLKIVSASRFTPRKNVAMIAEALALALPQLPGWSADILGQGPEEARILASTRDLVDRDVVRVGYASSVPAVLQGSRIYVSMIEPDNYPSQSVIEAMRAGNALILSSTGDSRRFLDSDLRNGVLVPLDAEELAAAIVDVASDPDRLNSMGRASADHLRAGFSGRSHVQELLDLHFGPSSG